MTDLRLLADVHISPLTCNGLRNAGYQVTRVTEVLSARTPDGEILKYARDHGHVILTQDLDFSALVAQSGQTAPSIVSLRLETPTPDRVTWTASRSETRGAGLH